MRFVLCALALAASAPAQIGVPLLGWVPEGAQIRPMNGLPGAAILGPAVNVGRRLANITVSPGQNYVLASDAETGSVLLIIPGVSMTTLALPAKPDRIVASPGGAAASLWYSAGAQLEIVSGLPAAPSIRRIDASALQGEPSAIALSDDGQSVAAASSAGVYEWDSNGAAHQIYSASDAGALAFFPGLSNLAVATSTQLFSFADSTATVLYQGSFSPAGLAVSFDNQEVVLADQNGTIYAVAAATHNASVTDCQCRPDGVFPLGGAVFRLTSATIGPIKLIDAEATSAAGVILAVPRAAPQTRQVVHPAQSNEPLPTLTINVTPTPTGFLQQPTMTITASSTYPDQINGNVTLTFTSDYSGTDNTIQFSNGLTTVNFIIPVGSTQAIFEGAPSATFSTGTIAGSIALAANITAPTPMSAVATQTFTTEPTVTQISSVQLQQTPGGVTVVIVGYSSTDSVESGTFTFALKSNATITTNDITVNVSTQFQAYYATTASYATGSEFTLSVPFAITGNPADLTGVTVTLLNGKGESNPATSQ